MDGGYAWTKTKRFLTIIPCIIFIIAINFVRNIDEITERNKYMVVNVVQTLVLLVAKMPHGLCIKNESLVLIKQNMIKT